MRAATVLQPLCLGCWGKREVDDEFVEPDDRAPALPVRFEEANPRWASRLRSSRT
ncbi:MAG: hypothetical protein SVG88_12600 [Halobacteriales archaeon]|nr:hypothetical protein [Halobacteriales archaeon]